jgi:hypothetical protein
MLLILLPQIVNAEQVASVTARGVVVALFEEDCALTDEVTNLPKRATWLSDGKTIEGCYGLFRESMALGLFFQDKTVVVIPIKEVKLVQDI